MLSITTAGFDRDSLWFKQRNLAASISDGTIDDPTFLPCVYAVPDDAPWDDDENWRRANPNFGVSIFPEFLRRQCLRAQESPEKQNAFQRLYLNQKTEQRTRWLSLQQWDECQQIMPNLNGRECFAGLDLASTRDISALVRLFPPQSAGEPWWVIPTFWVPEDTLAQRTREDKVPYLEWARRGLLRATPGNTTDYDYVRADIKAMAKRHVISECAIDRWNASQITNQLQDDGLPVVGFGQGFFSMNAPTKRVEVLILSKQLAHDGNPVLRWMVGNTTVATDPAGSIKPDKAHSTEKIDGVVALIMALGRAMVSPDHTAMGSDGGLFSVGL